MKIIKLSKDLKIETTDSSFGKRSSYISTIDQKWKFAVQKSKNKLFDGPLFSVNHISSNLIQVERSSYKFYYTQFDDTEVHNFQVRPLAVTGIFIVDDGFFIGQRNKRITTQHKGRWELVPSGTVEYSTLDRITMDDLTNQIVVEATEEIGINPSEISVDFAQIAIEDSKSGVVDIVFFLRTKKSRKWVEEKFKSSQNSEYSKLRWVSNSENEIHTLLKDDQTNLIEESRLILKYFYN